MAKAQLLLSYRMIQHSLALPDSGDIFVKKINCGGVNILKWVCFTYYGVHMT